MLRFGLPGIGAHALRPAPTPSAVVSARPPAARVGQVGTGPLDPRTSRRGGIR